MLREAAGWLIVLLIVGAVVGFGWMSQNPDAAWIERAEEWLVVGGLAEAFRDAYLGPPPEERAAREDDSGPEVIVIRPPPPDGPLDLTAMMGDERARSASEGSTEGGSGPAASTGTGRTAGARGAADRSGLAGAVGTPEIGEVEIPSLRRERDRVSIGDLEPDPMPVMVRRIYERTWLLPGTVLRTEPAAGSPEVARTRELASVPVLERSGKWLQVQLRGRTGWADPAKPELGARPRGRPSRDDRYLAQVPTNLLREVRERLGLRRPNRSLGPFALYTDLEDEELLAFLDGVADSLHFAYSARYGLEVPVRRSGPVVALFADESDYRAVARTGSSRSEHPSGFAIGGLAIFYFGDRPRPAMVSTLVHELTHALNRHAIGSGLPLWLEEGIAGDLGAVWIEDPDAPAPGLIAAAVERTQWWPQRIFQVTASTPIDISFEALAALEEANFYERTGKNNWHSTVFVRCLLDGGEGELADRFRSFVVEVARGGRATPRRLLDRLGRDWPEIEATCADHRRWLQTESRRLLPGDWQWYGPESGSSG